MIPASMTPPLPSPETPWAMFLDVDGTLLEFASRPDDVEPMPGLIGILAELGRSAPLALISGRRIADLDRLFAPLSLPAAGQHGAERRGADGRVHLAPVSKEALEPVCTRLRAWTQDRPGIVLEDKGLSLALHYRGVPDRAGEATEVLEEAARESGGAFLVKPGKMVVEFRPREADKGRAIEAFMGERPFAGCLPVFVGDDATDEEGFGVVNGLGGYSVKVGEGPTLARWRLENVGKVLAWLDRCVRSGAPKLPGD